MSQNILGTGLHTLHGREIRVSRTESYDAASRYLAVDDSTYDGAPDSNCPMGLGPTPDEAVLDLAEQMLDRAENEAAYSRIAMNFEGPDTSDNETLPEILRDDATELGE